MAFGWLSDQMCLVHKQFETLWKGKPLRSPGRACGGAAHVPDMKAVWGTIGVTIKYQ